ARRARGEPCPAEELCAGCPELAEPLRRRIHDLQSMEDFLAAGAGRTAGPLDPALTPTVPTPDPAAGWPCVPGYELLGELGRGGMGVVYRALDRRTGRVVALKTMQQRDARSLAFFKREFRYLQGVSHPNLAQLYGLESDGQNWLLTM